PDDTWGATPRENRTLPLHPPAQAGFFMFYPFAALLLQKIAVAQVPPGPQHDQIAASVATQAAQQVLHLLSQVFELLRLSLAVALQHGFIAVLLFSIAALVATFFLKDVPMSQQQPAEEADEESEVRESQVDVPVIP